MSRTVAREMAYKLLFSNQFNKIGYSQEDLLNFLDGEKITEEEMDYIKNMVNGVISNKDSLDSIIKSNVDKYALERIFPADHIALLLAVYEMKYTDTPAKVVINEAVNLVKKFSSDKSYGFVNSILSKILKGFENE